MKGSSVVLGLIIGMPVMAFIIMESKPWWHRLFKDSHGQKEKTQ